MATAARTLDRPRMSLRTRSLYTVGAIVAAVLLPQLFHLIGAAAGLQSAPGEIFLPMHLPIILVGLLAGPSVGLVAGLVAPAISFATTGMPGLAMLPFMTIELGVYGLVSGLLCEAKLPTLAKVLIAQVAGRAVRAVAILLAVNVFGVSAISTSVILTSIAVGLPGLVLQWVLIPLVVYRVQSSANDD